jgi:hypothetical protein
LRHNSLREIHANPRDQPSYIVFLRQIGEALAPYQLIEELLKLYIEATHLKIQKTLIGKIPFRYPHSEYENAPLERLITMFSRHSDNEDLIKRLRSALKKRNYVAHTVVGHYMGHRKKDPTMTRSSILEDLTKIKGDGSDLVAELGNELIALLSDVPRRITTAS